MYAMARIMANDCWKYCKLVNHQGSLEYSAPPRVLATEYGPGPFLVFY